MVKRIDPALCAKCKGSRRLCGRPVCPILKRIESSVKVSSVIRRRELFAATPPSVLVGERGYPHVWLGPSVAPVSGEGAALYDDPEAWWGRMSLEDIIGLRASMVFSRFRARIADARRPSSRLLDLTRELALSARPVDAEYVFRKPPVPRVRFDGVLSPIGPGAELRDLRLAQNPVVPRKVDSLVDDRDATAREAAFELYDWGVSYYHIVRIFSLGMLGLKRQRRLVPTRWAITAVDSILGDRLLEKVREFEPVSDVELYRADYLGNRYAILVAPGAWSFEMIEIWLPRSVWVRGRKPYVTVNYELHDGKWRLPGVDGGYHAIRFPVLEALYRRRRQAVVVAVREVTPDYYAPVGSWQIRESVRRALASEPLRFASVEEALRAVSRIIETPVSVVLSKSHLLRFLTGQRKLTEFMG
ncbi:MAG: hypothetical protein DRJ56_03815 [Thermoprotei archaeon]|nr:MAG: hypothetical protein DRJ56_03815 [Thermoprotei archaeon]